MSCSPSKVHKITNCSDCTSSPTQFWCVSNQTCYCLNNRNTRICSSLLEWSDGGNDLFVKPCVVSPSVPPPVDCPPSYLYYCMPDDKLCPANKPPTCSPSEKVCPGPKVCAPTYQRCPLGGRTCPPSKYLCTPSALIPKCKAAPMYPQTSTSTDTKSPDYQKRLAEYKAYEKALKDYSDSLPRQPPPFDSESDPEWAARYKDSQFCYDCDACKTGPYVPPEECTYGICVVNDNGNQIMRCISPTNRGNICKLHKSNYCLGKDRKWIKTSNPNDCYQYPPSSSPSSPNCQQQFPFKFSKRGPKLNPGGIGLRLRDGKRPIVCKPSGRFSISVLLLIIIASVLGGTCLILLIIYYFF
jgi:hypothetical protein